MTTKLTPAGDMLKKTTGPYFSPLLLHAIHAEASRHASLPGDGAAYSVSYPRTATTDNQDKANSLLANILLEPPLLTTVQALLIMSGRDLAMGAAHAGWLKSGMAFRMVTEIGLEPYAYLEVAALSSERKRKHV